MPPLSWNCRCWVTEHAESELAADGITPTERPDIPNVEYENPKTGERITVPAGVHPGFGQRNWDTAVREVYEQRLAAARPEVRRGVKAGTPEGRLQALVEPDKTRDPVIEDKAPGGPDWGDEPNLPPLLAQKMTEQADATIHLPHEVGVIYGSDGQWVVRPKKGTRGRVRWTKEERRRARGHYYFHNHPSGGTFSPADVFFGVGNQLRAVVAEGIASDGHRYRYVLLPPPEGWSHDALDEIADRWAELYLQVVQKYWGLPLAEREQRAYEEVWQQMSDELLFRASRRRQ